MVATMEVRSVVISLLIPVTPRLETTYKNPSASPAIFAIRFSEVGATIEIRSTLPLDKKDLEEFASAVEDRFNNPFVNHELMSISLNSASKWKARNMPSFLAYIEEQKQLPKCLTMSLAAYIAFYSSDIQERTADGLICKRPAGNTYKIQDDAWALDFYYAHKDDTAAQLVHAVLTNTQMWDQDLTKIEGLEAAVLADLEMIRTQGAEAAYKSCL